MMISTHKRLAHGLKVDPKLVSNLLLGGVINILAQHDTIASIEEKLKIVQHEIITNNTRIESLENWVLKQDNEINQLNDKLSCLDRNGVVLKDSKEIEDLKKKITSLEIDVNLAKKVSNSKTRNKEPELQEMNADSRKKIKCETCGKTFKENYELEIHIEEHDAVKKFKCEVCGKDFYLKWRLQKHTNLHTKAAKPCKYFSSNQNCPFERVGCMFLHSVEASDDQEANSEVEE